MKCPYCDQEMELGNFRSSGKIMWLPWDQSAPFPPTRKGIQRKGGVLLPYETGILYGHFPSKAHFCRSCNRIILNP